MQHVMVDLETIGYNARSAIVSIGAVKFDLGGAMDEEFYMLVNVESCLDLGLEVDPDSILRWLQQGSAARAALSNPTTSSFQVQDALRHFAGWFKGSTYLWSHGATFAAVVLAEAFRLAKQPLPWRYDKVRDTRTLFDLAGRRPPVQCDYKLEHHALSDAKEQALQVQRAYDKLRIDEVHNYAST